MESKLSCSFCTSLYTNWSNQGLREGAEGYGNPFGILYIFNLISCNYRFCFSGKMVWASTAQTYEGEFRNGLYNG